MKLIYKIVAALVLVTAVLAVGTPVAVAQEEVPGDPINYYGDAVAADGVLAGEQRAAAGTAQFLRAAARRCAGGRGDRCGAGSRSASATARQRGQR